jgi:hypothetical protein
MTVRTARHTVPESVGSESGSRTSTPDTGYCADGTHYVPVTSVDVAGLIPGAYEGNGLGSRVLTDLNEPDVLIHAVDFSGRTNAEGEPAEGHDPRDGVDFLGEELEQWYLEIPEKVSTN